MRAPGVGQREYRSAEGERGATGWLLAHLAREARALVRNEVALARAEVMSSTARVRRDAVRGGLGAVLLGMAFLLLCGAAVAGLATVMPLWGAAILVGICLGGAGAGILLKLRYDLRRRTLGLPRTCASIREDRAMIKEHLS